MHYEVWNGQLKNVQAEAERMGSVTIINQTNAPINASISAGFNYDWCNYIPPNQYTILQAGDVWVTLNARWGIGRTSEYENSITGIVMFAVGTTVAVASLVLAAVTAGAALPVLVPAWIGYAGAAGGAVAAGGVYVTEIGFAANDFISTPANETGVYLAENRKYVVEGGLAAGKPDEKRRVEITGEEKGNPLKLRRIDEKEFSELVAKGLVPMRPVFPVGGATTRSTPFVTRNGWVWFRGMNDALEKICRDGTHPSNPGGAYTASSPVVVGDWVYFQGTDNSLWRMKWRVETDETDPPVNIGGAKTRSAPFVTSDGWVWFQGENNALEKMRSDGTEPSNPGGATTQSTPFVTSDGWVWFQGGNKALEKMRSDGTEPSNPGGAYTASSPVVVGDWVYFQGTDNRLLRMKTDGSDLGHPGGAYTASSPVVVGVWVYFQGTDDSLWRMRADGSEPAVNIFSIKTRSAPFVTSDDDWAWFRGENNNLNKVCCSGNPEAWNPEMRP
jgi:hypothetical protein